jgi:polyphenol oxidase
MLTLQDCIEPEWPAPNNVRAIFTTRAGGVSQNTAQGELASLNLGKSVGDDPAAVAENRRRVATLIGHQPNWISLVHGTDVALLDEATSTNNIVADAAVARRHGVVCTVTMADCLPVIFTDVTGSVVAAAHAGWRGLAAGVLESTITAMQVPPQSIMVYLGQAIGPTQFEVGEDVRAAFTYKNINPNIDGCFQPFMAGNSRKYLANIFMLARLRLEAAGIPSAQIYGGDLCTASDASRFFSYRREGKTGRQSGRMAALIWRD